MKLTTIGIDLAKNVFQVHGTDDKGRAVLKKQLKRAQMAAFFANLPSCRIGLEACGSAHYWARKLQALGHTVQLIAPQYVKPFVKRNKNDAADAEAICEAVTRPNMPTVPIKNAEQQAILSVHRARQGFVKARTAQANQIRGLLAEYGTVLPQGMSHVVRRVPEIIEDGENDLPGSFRLTSRNSTARSANWKPQSSRGTGRTRPGFWHQTLPNRNSSHSMRIGHDLKRYIVGGGPLTVDV